MLKQILADMYIDPELLAELSEEQKQILFFKMREEQVRRWKEREAKQNKDSPKCSKPRKASRKTVHWKIGSDQEVWVWVMGEHALDKPYDVLCDEIIAERARKQAEKEAEERRKRQEEEFSKLTEAMTLRSPSETAERRKPNTENKKIAKEAVKTPKEMKINEKKSAVIKSEEKENESVEERTQEIYMNWKEAQEIRQKIEKEDLQWKESLRKSKAADERRRSMAKQARDDYKRLSLQAVEKGSVAQRAKRFGGEVPRPPLPPKPKLEQSTKSSCSINRSDRRQGVRRLNSGSSRDNIIKWFKEEQLPLQAGWDRSQTCIASWFHGIISRLESENLLKSHVEGSFLIRVSEKIHGYVLSFRHADGYLHFLIDASGTSYSFLGVDQLQHATLADLVEYHKTEPITSLGKELLLYPCGQRQNSCDYSDLIS